MSDMYAAEPAARLAPGTRLNGIYEIDVRIASGGMGEIYRGHAIETGDLVAIKVMRTDLADNETALALFRKEASALHFIYNEAIVRYYAFASDPGIRRHYLAMEFVDGVPLSDLLKHAPLGFDAVQRLQQRIAAGLYAAHQHGIVHRDISPDNILIPGGDVGGAKIIDFGIARSLKAGAGTIIGSGFAGKYNYVSPEQLGLFGGDVTAKSDIYSLGIVLAECLLGQPIDMGGSQFQVLEKRRVVPDLSAVDPRFRPLLVQMLQPDPKDRPASMAEVAAWRPGAAPPEPDDGAASRRGTTKPDARPHREPASARGRWLALAALAGVLLAGGGGAVFYLTRFDTGVPDGDSVKPPILDPAQAERLRRDREAAQRDAEERARAQAAAAEAERQRVAGDAAARRDAEERARVQALAEAEQQRIAREAAAKRDAEERARRESAAEAERQRLEREAAAKRDAEERLRQQTAAEAERQRLEREATAKRDAEERARREAAAEAERQRLEREAAAKRDAEERARQAAAEAERKERIEREAAAAKRDQEERERQQALAGAERQRLEREAAIKHEEEERQRQQAAAEAERKERAEREAAAKRDQEERERQQALAGAERQRLEREAAIKREEEERQRQQAAAEAERKERIDKAAAQQREAEERTRQQLAAVAERRLRITNFVNSYEGGDCFFVTPVVVAENQATLEGYGSSVVPFEVLDYEFKRANGFEASIGLHQVTRRQCAAVSFLSRLRNQPGTVPRLDIGAVSLKSGGTLTGTVKEFGNRNVHLLLISDDGLVHDLTGMLKVSGDARSFSLRMERTDAGPPQPQVVIAVVSNKPLEALKLPQPAGAEAVFGAALAEALKSGQALNVSARYFKLEK